MILTTKSSTWPHPELGLALLGLEHDPLTGQLAEMDVRRQIRDRICAERGWWEVNSLDHGGVGGSGVPTQLLLRRLVHNRLAWGGRVVALVHIQLEPRVLEEGLKGLWSWIGRW